jgi:hypothetical protein
MDTRFLVFLCLQNYPILPRQSSNYDISLIMSNQCHNIVLFLRLNETKSVNGIQAKIGSFVSLD